MDTPVYAAVSETVESLRMHPKIKVSYVFMCSCSKLETCHFLITFLLTMLATRMLLLLSSTEKHKSTLSMLYLEILIGREDLD